jgi:hypothetical protein
MSSRATWLWSNATPSAVVTFSGTVWQRVQRPRAFAELCP